MSEFESPQAGDVRFLTSQGKGPTLASSGAGPARLRIVCHDVVAGGVTVRYLARRLLRRDVRVLRWASGVEALFRDV